MKRITTYFTMILALACCLQAEAQDSGTDTKPLVMARRYGRRHEAEKSTELELSTPSLTTARPLQARAIL